VTRSDRSATTATGSGAAKLSRGFWFDMAACRDVDPEIFFPIGTTGAAAEQVQQARAICVRCPVATDCLDWAQRMGLGDGVWGGTTPEERRALRRSTGLSGRTEHKQKRRRPKRKPIP
jgi:WhiB family transcriptional regulator, redox-sensing transcriptional regulator